MLHLRCCSSPKSASEQFILYYIKYQKTLYGCIHLYSVLLLLLILISFTELQYFLTQFLRLCFYSLGFIFLYNISSKWMGTYLYMVLLVKYSKYSKYSFIRNFGCSFDFSTWNMLLKNAFIYETFFNSKAILSTGIFLISFTLPEL